MPGGDVYRSKLPYVKVTWAKPVSFSPKEMLAADQHVRSKVDSSRPPSGLEPSSGQPSAATL